jgi:hypothetical protein
MDWQLEVLKLCGSAFAGFFVGRFQTSYSDRVSRNKDIQNELLKAIRACSTAAIDYHSQTVPANQLAVKSFHLKNQLWRIRTDVLLIARVCSVKKEILLPPSADFFDSVTEYPFEPTELPSAVDRARLIRITQSAESLALLVSSSKPKLF